MSQILASHWTEQRVCGHFNSSFALLQIRGGGTQIREACLDCGKTFGTAAPRSEHPDAAEYPVVVPHPRPCECHTDRKAPTDEIDYGAYIGSQEWAERRRYYVAKALHCCQLCNWRSPDGRGLNVHHRTYERLGREFDSDVIVLCRPCHAKFHDVLEDAA